MPQLTHSSLATPDTHPPFPGTGSCAVSAAEVFSVIQAVLPWGCPPACLAAELCWPWDGVKAAQTHW